MILNKRKRVMQVKVTWGKSLDKVVKEGWNLNDEEETYGKIGGHLFHYLGGVNVKSLKLEWACLISEIERLVRLN